MKDKPQMITTEGTENTERSKGFEFELFLLSLMSGRFRFHGSMLPAIRSAISNVSAVPCARNPATTPVRLVAG